MLRSPRADVDAGLAPSCEIAPARTAWHGALLGFAWRPPIAAGVLALGLVPVHKVLLVVGLSKDLGRDAAAAGAMAAAAWMLRNAEPVTGMVVAVSTYFASMYLLGAIRREDVRCLGDVVHLRSPV